MLRNGDDDVQKRRSTRNVVLINLNNFDNGGEIDLQ